LRLTDFGVARIMMGDNSHETSGTPGYMAPEVMCRQNHGLTADYFAVGVIAYECMMGRRPYVGRNRKEIREQILCKQV
jgi:serine/threonine protein kinase